MINPLHHTYQEEKDEDLVRETLKGNREALDSLIHRHQPFIYNVAWKMVHNPADAKDLTQETLLKVITKLSQFNFNSSLRTWLYRIVVNEFLQSKRRKHEASFSGFENFGERLDSFPNPDLTVEEEIEFKELSRDMQIRCLSGMLMCLSREQRLIFILGDTFGIDHILGAEIFNISKENFRIKLHRARKDLKNFMEAKCGLINSNNPCRCPKKTKALASSGLLDPGMMQFNIPFRQKIADYVQANHTIVLDQIEEKITALYQDHPLEERFDKETIISKILQDASLLRLFEAD